jgi:signal transduction histidine kinase
MPINYFDGKQLFQDAIDRHPPIVTTDMLLIDVISRMNQARSTFTLVVEQEKLVGIFTERDVVKMSASKMSPEGVIISQVMTPNVITINREDNYDIYTALNLLRSSGIRHLPILDAQGKVFGIITRESLRQVLKPTDLLEMRHVEDIITPTVMTAPTTATVWEISEMMASKRKSCIVICSPSDDIAKLQKPEGIITERDIVKFAANGIDISLTTTAEVMSCPLLPVKLSATLWEAHDIMQHHKIRRLVVVDDAGYLAGIITQSTLLEAINPLEMHATVELLQQTITEKTQELTKANRRMEQEVLQRKKAEEELRKAKDNLEELVAERTLELIQANARLQAEIRDRIQAEAEVRYLNAVLEERVRERTAQLEASNHQLSQTLEHLRATQEELIHAEKMAALGQLVAGVAHEINNPLGAIRASISNISAAMETSLRQLPQIFQQLSPEEQARLFELIEFAKSKTTKLSFKEERQLKRSLKQELQSYKIEDTEEIAASFINLGITEDVARFFPLLQSRNFKLILETADSIIKQKNNSANIRIAVDRAEKIVFALKNYARQDSNEKMTKTNITAGIDVVLTLYQHQLKHGVIVEKNYQEIPEIIGYPESLNQVWSNLIHNAIQAMNGQGKLEINVFQEDNHVVTQIIDSGCGIKPEIKDKIFQPFFTTKPPGEGSGLGLDIVGKIIAKHQGSIKFNSQPGRTQFNVLLPINC